MSLEVLFQSRELSGESFCLPLKAYHESNYRKAVDQAFDTDSTVECVCAFVLHFFPALAVLSLASVGLAYKKWVALPELLRHNEKQKKYILEIAKNPANALERTPLEKGDDPELKLTTLSSHYVYFDGYLLQDPLQQKEATDNLTKIMDQINLQNSEARRVYFTRGCGTFCAGDHVRLYTKPYSTTFAEKLYHSTDLPGDALLMPLERFEDSAYMSRCNGLFNDKCNDASGGAAVAWRIAEFCLHLIPRLVLGIVAAIGCAVKLTGIPALNRYNEALKEGANPIEVQYLDFATASLRKTIQFPFKNCRFSRFN